MKTLTFFPRSFVLLALTLILEAGVLRAATVTLRPVADTTLLSLSPYTTNNLGGGPTFQAGGGKQFGNVTRGLMRFDINGNVPAGSTINSVSLTLNVVATTPSGAVNSMFDLNRVLVSWGEGNKSDHRGSPAAAGEASWRDRLGPGSPWSTPGGDYFATASASRLITGNGAYPFASTAGLVGDVQGWLNNPASNFGWLLRSQSEGSAGTIRRFASREDLANSPMLTINFTPIPEPGAWALLGLGAILLGAVSRGRTARSRD